MNYKEYVLIKILGMGDNVCDIYLHTKTMYPGGQALNVTVFAARQGAEASFLGVFGKDELAAHIRKTLDELGIAHLRCREYEGENGFARVSLVNGDRVFMGSNKGGVIQKHPIILDDEDLAYIAEFDLLHTSNNGFVDGELPKLDKLPCLVSYDFSLSWKEEGRIQKVAPYVDFCFVSCGNAERETVERLMRRIHEAGCSVIIATMGKAGALLFDGENLLSQSAGKEPAIDTMGAGDGFASAFLVSAVSEFKRRGITGRAEAFLRREVYAAALTKAAAFATEVCMVSGAFGYGVPVPAAVWNRIQNR
jgi:sugar/nucleoside kinase (ribokinase family)